MLVCDTNRSHYHYPSSPPYNHYPYSPSYSNQHRNYYVDTSPYSASTASPSTIAYLDTTQPSTLSSNYTSSLPLSGGQLMSSFGYSNPAIRVQNATPTPSYQSASGYQQNSALVGQSPSASNSWNIQANNNARMVATGSPALQAAGLNRGIKRSHQRTSSNSSSIASSGGISAYNGHATSYPYGSSPSMSTASKLNQSYHMDSSRAFSHNLPTPTQTPTQDSFVGSQYQNYSPHHDQATMASLVMNRAMDHQSGAEEDVPGMSHSGRHSVSSMGQEPTTPHTVVDGYDGDFKIPSHDTHIVPRFDRTISDMKQTVPKFDRTMSDIYGDELYDPSAVAPPVKPVGTSFLTPYQRNSKVTEALQAAQNARSQSPNSQLSRGVSPFRPDSPYVQDAGRMLTAAQLRAEQKAQADMRELSQHMSPRHEQAPKTISPKDAMLEYRPDDDAGNASLFPQEFDSQTYDGQANAQFGQNFNNFANNSRTSNWGANRQQQYQSSPLAAPQPPQQATFNFNAPSVPASQFQSVPFDYRQAAAVKQDPTPDFPAHLTSMESSASEAPASSQSSNQQASAVTSMPSNSSIITKPGNGATLADSGAFTCTYNGCSMRFPTQQKLQKHKREGHRQSAILIDEVQEHTPGVGSGMSSAALLARNSQSGPHKCDRINPTTGKPCNAIFSRPYDLTRHEDTIHNMRKQKVRCALCVEEKTFSRNDALTRHMRVVHPEVDFPGKHRRRGGVE